MTSAEKATLIDQIADDFRSYGCELADVVYREQTTGRRFQRHDQLVTLIAQAGLRVLDVANGVQEGAHG